MKVGARQCEVVEISSEEATSFLNNYHRQKSVQAIYNIALKYQNDIIALMTFGYPRYNPKYQWELLRLCFHPNYTISGGSEKLFKYFLEKYDPHSIISYCDYNYFTGEVYDRLGFNKLRVSTGSKIWYKGDRFITDNLLRQFGADKLIGTRDGKGTNNEEIMLREGWKFKIDEKGQGTYIWNGKGKFGYIYLVTDTLHSKQYIGQHRGYKLDEKYFGSGQIIRSIIKKYGTDILKIEVLDWADSQEDLSEKEIKYINEYNTLYPNGYNLTLRKQAIESYTVKNTISDETREKLRQSTTKMWQDENFRQHFSDIQKRLWENPNYRKRQSMSRKSAWQDENYRSFQLDILKKARENPNTEIKRIEACQSEDYKKLHSRLSTEMWKNEEYSKKMLQIRKEQVTEETRLNMSQAQMKRFSNSNEREKISNSLKHVFATTDLRDRISKTSKELWQNEDYRNKISIARKEQWKNLEYREKHHKDIENFWNDTDKRESWLKNHNKAMRSPEHRKKVSENALGRKWWNNGTINKFTKEKPEGDEWKEGRLLKKSK